ncbi:hypothetical protein ES703_73359 [subsurface metagenome]
MEILLYENRKIDPICWDASTPEKKKASLLALFRYFDKRKFYASLEGFPKGLARAEKEIAAFKEGKAVVNPILYEAFDLQIAACKISLSELKASAEQYELLVLARKGDIEAVESLLYWRKNAEYEYFSFVKCIDPCSRK